MIPIPALILDVGCGVLESLLFDHEEELWPTIERAAREDVRFRRALAAVWAYDSPLFERREALLSEFGESRTITVSFVIEPDDFNEPPSVSHRAVSIDGEVPGRQLPRIPRQIADGYETTHAEPPPLVMRDRRLREAFLAVAGGSPRVDERVPRTRSVAGPRFTTRVGRPNREPSYVRGRTMDGISRRHGTRPRPDLTSSQDNGEHSSVLVPTRQSGHAEPLGGFEREPST